MTKKFIIRSIAAAAVSFAAKLIVKKIQEETVNKTSDAEDDIEKEKTEIGTPETNAYSPHGKAV